MALCTLGHVELRVPNIDETYDHYHDVIGLEEETREEIRDGTYLFERNGYDELFEDLDVVGPEDSIQ